MARTGFATLFARLRPPDAYPGDAVTDAELLRRYAEGRDPAAFELLVWRHGPLVLGTCRRVARHEADAEDAFQATFLVLARKAAGVRQSLPGFLHRTARRAALRAVSRRRVATLTADVPSTPRPGLDTDELTLLDAAIDGLGERHRRVVVLCYLQGHSTDAAATILGVPRGTVLSRLSTARTRLAKTLTRRGVTLPAALVTATLTFDRVAACVELTLNPRAAVPAAAIAQGVLTMMLRHQLAVTAVALTLVGVGVTGTGVALMPQPGGNRPPVPAAVAAAKDDPAVKVAVLNTQIVTTERKLADAVEQWKHSVPKVPAGELRGKAELLSAINLLVFKSEVEIRKYELRIEPMQKGADAVNKLTPTEDQILEMANRLPGDDPNDPSGFHKAGDSFGSAKYLLTLRKNEIKQFGSNQANRQGLKEAEEWYDKSKATYLKMASERMEFATQFYRQTRIAYEFSNLSELIGLLKKEKLNLSVITEKRQLIAIELAKLEAVPAEPAAVVALRQELATLTASREALKAQHPGAFDPATRSAVAMEGLLHELVELRGEVKKLRDGK